MMRFLASYVLRGPMQAILVAAAFAMLSMLMPPITWILTFLSGGAIALVTLRVGIQKGLLVSLGAIAGTALMAYLAGGQVQLALYFALMLWMPVWIVAAILRYTRSLAWTLQAVGLIGSLIVALVFLVLGDPVQYWVKVLENIRPLLEKLSASTDPESVNQMIALLANMMTGSSVAYVGIVLILSLLVGRGWQAMLFNPGGLRDEFNQLRFSKQAGVITLAVLIFSLITGNFLLINISIVLGMVYMFYGLAVVHGLLAANPKGNFFLVGVYVLLLIAGEIIVPILMVLALSDTWVDYRSRLKSAS